MPTNVEETLEHDLTVQSVQNVMMLEAENLLIRSFVVIGNTSVHAQSVIREVYGILPVDMTAGKSVDRGGGRVVFLKEKARINPNFIINHKERAGWWRFTAVELALLYKINLKPSI